MPIGYTMWKLFGTTYTKKNQYNILDSDIPAFLSDKDYQTLVDKIKNIHQKYGEERELRIVNISAKNLQLLKTEFNNHKFEHLSEFPIPYYIMSLKSTPIRLGAKSNNFTYKAV